MYACNGMQTTSRFKLAVHTFCSDRATGCVTNADDRTGAQCEDGSANRPKIASPIAQPFRVGRLCSEHAFT